MVYHTPQCNHTSCFGLILLLISGHTQFALCNEIQGLEFTSDPNIRPFEHFNNGPYHDHHIFYKCDIFYIYNIIGQFLIPLDRISSTHLRQAGQSRANIVAVLLFLRIVRQILLKQRAGTNNGHIAFKNIDQLRQLIQ